MISAQNNDKQYYEDREKVENATPKFNPAYFKNKENRHIAVFIDIKEQQLFVSKKTAQIRPGNIPYKIKEGPFKVIWSKEQKELGRYAIRDPFMVDSYDPIDGTKEGMITPIKNGEIEILLPYDLGIHSLKLIRGRKKLNTLNISDVIKNAKPAVIIPKEKGDAPADSMKDKKE